MDGSGFIKLSSDTLNAKRRFWRRITTLRKLGIDLPYIRDFNWALLDVDESVNIMVKTLISVLEATIEENDSNEKVDKGVQSENVEKKNAETKTEKEQKSSEDDALGASMKSIKELQKVVQIKQNRIDQLYEALMQKKDAPSPSVIKVERDKLAKDNQRLKKDTLRLKKDIETLRRQLDDQISMIANMTLIQQTLELERDNQTNIRAVYERSIANMTKTHESLMAEKSKFESELKDIQISKKNLENDCMRYKECIVNLEEKLSKMNKDCEMLEERLALKVISSCKYCDTTKEKKPPEKPDLKAVSENDYEIISSDEGEFEEDVKEKVLKHLDDIDIKRSNMMLKKELRELKSKYQKCSEKSLQIQDMYRSLKTKMKVPQKWDVDLETLNLQNKLLKSQNQ